MRVGATLPLGRILLSGLRPRCSFCLLVGTLPFGGDFWDSLLPGCDLCGVVAFLPCCSLGRIVLLFQGRTPFLVVCSHFRCSVRQ